MMSSEICVLCQT